MSPGERVDFDTVRGLVKAIEDILASDRGRQIPANVKLALTQDLIVRRQVSAVYMRRSVGAASTSPIVEGNRRHRFWQDSLVEIESMMRRHNLRAIAA